VNNKKMAENKDVRIFAIHSVYYDKDGVPDGSSRDAENLGGFETLEDLKGNIDKVNEAFKKPILDLDNWPNEWDDGDPYDLSVHSSGSDFYKKEDEDKEDFKDTEIKGINFNDPEVQKHFDQLREKRKELKNRTRFKG